MGILLVILAHRGQTFSAAMLAFFGIFLSTVGLEPVKYTKRFTFDQTWLSSGVDLIVVVLGLFAISQALLLLVDKEHAPGEAHVRGNIFAGLKELLGLKRIATVSSSLGVLMGMVPAPVSSRRSSYPIPMPRRPRKSRTSSVTAHPKGWWHPKRQTTRCRGQR